MHRRFLVSAGVALAVLTTSALPPATAAPADRLPAGTLVAATATGGFYSPPSQLPARNGAVIRHEPMDFYLDPAGLTPAPASASAQRIMYRSTDTHGRAVATTGTVLTPASAWQGPGSRPLVGYAVGTQGLADRCAPSRQLEAGTEYEGAFISGLLQRGYGVVVPDYEGLGTPGVHTYVVRRAQAHALLDAVRAAQRLRVAHLPDHGPVGLAGYSQGGARRQPQRRSPSAMRPR